jgi:hypothetical protein
VFNIFKKRSDEGLITDNEAACQRDDEIMGEYVQDMDSGKRAKLSPEQLQKHLQEASQIEGTRNELIDRGYSRSHGRWQKGG